MKDGYYNMSFVISYVILLISLVILVNIISSYVVHISMTLDEHIEYDYVHFKTFLEEYKKYENDPDLEHSKDGRSIFLMKCDGYNINKILYLHAGIVMINDKCMIFYPFSWLKYCIWMRQFKPTTTKKRVKGLWDNK